MHGSWLTLEREQRELAQRRKHGGHRQQGAVGQSQLLQAGEPAQRLKRGVFICGKGEAAPQWWMLSLWLIHLRLAKRKCPRSSLLAGSSKKCCKRPALKRSPQPSHQPAAGRSRRCPA
jgi:hypothetical protein